MVTLLVKEQISAEIARLQFSDGSAFFIRTSYLKTESVIELLTSGTRSFERALEMTDPSTPSTDSGTDEFTDEEYAEIVDAGLAYSAERKACEYLARCEHCRAQLKRKLTKKNYDKNGIEAALDYLEEKNYLNDERFAFSWIRSHELTKPQGAMRLETELANRGVKKQAAKNAIAAFFEENDEEEICLRALEKLKKKNKSPEKIFNALFQQGFSYKLINHCLKLERS